jgi:S1-C subfamily serine protease
MRTFVLGIASSLALSGAALAGPNQKADDALASAPDFRNSIVMISIQCPGDTRPYPLGAGVVVSGDGLVLTAAHVGKNCPHITAARMGAVTSPYQAPGTNLQAVRIKRRVDRTDEAPDAATTAVGVFEDLALYRITNMAGSGLVPATIAKRYPVPGEDVMVVGFAGMPFWYAGAPIRDPGLTIFKTSLSSVAADTQDVPFRIHYTGATLPGVSGGPVFNSNGELVAIHSGRIANCCSPANIVLDNYSWGTSVEAIPPAWKVPR